MRVAGVGFAWPVYIARVSCRSGVLYSTLTKVMVLKTWLEQLKLEVGIAYVLA